MKKIYNIYKKEGMIVTIGIFDGVHRGHQKILKKLLRVAVIQKAKTMVITFQPHPQKVLNPGANILLLMSLEHRMKLIRDMGVDFCLALKFTKEFSKLTAEDFIERTLLKAVNLKALIVGKNFLFGFKEKGGCALLKKISIKHNFKLYCVAPLKFRKRIISSTRIREAIEKGDLKLGSLMLGRPVTILGTVVKGRRIGRLIGFPTANINPHHESIPPSGVYSVDATIDEKIHSGILNIGIRPTFASGKEPSIEIHIFNFKKNIYGKDIEIIFKRKIRNEIKFNSLEELKKQIKLDILRVSQPPNI